jgi:hypothetical protein
MTGAQMQVEYVAFPTREHRIRYLARRYAPQLAGSVLDVGCGEAHPRDPRV